MQQETVRNIRKCAQRGIIICEYGTSRYVPARHDKDVRSAVSSVEEQRMKRRVGQHHAEPCAEAEGVERPGGLRGCYIFTF